MTRGRRTCDGESAPDGPASFLASIPCTEGLTDLSVRWMQPIQQQGRRTPSVSSLQVLSICSLLVSAFFTETTQQIHSFRASGVKPFHFTIALGLDVSAFRKSAGTLCTTPVAIALLLMGLLAHRPEVRENSMMKSRKYLPFSPSTRTHTSPLAFIRTTR